MKIRNCDSLKGLSKKRAEVFRRKHLERIRAFKLTVVELHKYGALTKEVFLVLSDLMLESRIEHDKLYYRIHGHWIYLLEGKWDNRDINVDSLSKDLNSRYFEFPLTNLREFGVTEFRSAYESLGVSLKNMVQNIEELPRSHRALVKAVQPTRNENTLR